MHNFRPRLLALSLALFLAACASSPGPGGVMQVREADGVSAERLGRIGPVMRAELDKGTFPRRGQSGGPQWPCDAF